MKVVVLFLTSLFIIYLTEKEYRNRKLFLYPSLLLCPVIGVIAYAGVLLSSRSVSGSDQKSERWKKGCAVLLFMLVLILGGSRTLGEWFSQMLQFFGSMDLQKAIFAVAIVVSLFIYMFLAQKLCGGKRVDIVLFMLFICLMNLCGYRFGELSESFLLGKESLDILILRQIVTPLLLLILLRKGTKEQMDG